LIQWTCHAERIYTTAMNARVQTWQVSRALSCRRRPGPGGHGLAGVPLATAAAVTHDEHGLYVRLRTRKRRVVANRRWGVVGRFGWACVNVGVPAGYVASPRPATAEEGAAALRTANGGMRPDQVRDCPYDPVAVRTCVLRVVLCWKRLRWTRSIRLCAGLAEGIRRPALIMRGPCVLACLESGLNPPPIPCIETGYRSTCHFVSRLQCCGLE
jgi:hypothetical protein